MATIPAFLPIILLIMSNIFMIFAWYWHLKVDAMPILGIVMISWAIAFPEYLLAVPANRIGYGFYTAAELRTLQVVISLAIFSIFAALYLGEKIMPMQLIGFACIALGAYLVFAFSSAPTKHKNSKLAHIYAVEPEARTSLFSRMHHSKYVKKRLTKKRKT